MGTIGVTNGDNKSNQKRQQMRQPCGIQDFAKSPVSSIGFIELLAGTGGNLPMPPLTQVCVEINIFNAGLR